MLKKMRELRNSFYRSGAGDTLQGVIFKIPDFVDKEFSAYIEATDSCNTAMEREYFKLLEDSFKNCRKCSN